MSLRSLCIGFWKLALPSIVLMGLFSFADAADELVISLNGPADIKLPLNAPYIEQGAVVLDSAGNIVSTEPVVTYTRGGEVDTSVEGGEFHINYSYPGVRDSELRVVRVSANYAENTPPEVNLPAIQEVVAGVSHPTAVIAACTDDEDGPITGSNFAVSPQPVYSMTVGTVSPVIARCVDSDGVETRKQGFVRFVENPTLAAQFTCSTEGGTCGSAASCLGVGTPHLAADCTSPAVCCVPFANAQNNNPPTQNNNPPGQNNNLPVIHFSPLEYHVPVGTQVYPERDIVTCTDSDGPGPIYIGVYPSMLQSYDPIRAPYTVQCKSGFDQYASDTGYIVFEPSTDPNNTPPTLNIEADATHVYGTDLYPINEFATCTDVEDGGTVPRSRMTSSPSMIVWSTPVGTKREVTYKCADSDGAVTTAIGYVTIVADPSNLGGGSLCSAYAGASCQDITTACAGSPFPTDDCTSPDVCCIPAGTQLPLCTDQGGFNEPKGQGSCVGGRIVPASGMGSDQVCCIPGSCSGMGGSCVNSAARTQCLNDGGFVNNDTDCSNSSPASPYCCLPSASCAVQAPNNGEFFAGTCTTGTGCAAPNVTQTSADCSSRGQVCCYDPSSPPLSSPTTPPVLKGGLVPCGHAGLPDCGFCEFGKLVHNVLNWLVRVSTIVLTILIIAGGIILSGSGGSVAVKTTVRRLIANAIIGFVILLLAWFIVDFFLTILLATGNADVETSKNFGPWKDIVCLP